MKLTNQVQQLPQKNGGSNRNEWIRWGYNFYKALSQTKVKDRELL